MKMTYKCSNCGRDFDRSLSGANFDSSLPPHGDSTNIPVISRCDICYSAAIIAKEQGLEKMADMARDGVDVRLAIVGVDQDGMVTKVVAVDLWPWLRKSKA